jgi:hypothetical protein
VVDFHKVTDPDLPALHRSANDASVSAQAEHTMLIRVILVLLVLGAASNALTIDDLKIRGMVLWGAALGLLISMVLSFVIRIRKQDKIWFAARALAESVKTMSWRYMMSADPYQSNVNQAFVDSRFQDDLKRLITMEKEVFGSLRPADSGAAQITGVMRQIRSSPFNDRLRTYVEARIKDQQGWYSKKAVQNQRNATIFFWLTVAAQLVAVVSAFQYANSPGSALHPAGLFAALATALIAWVQLRRHDELAKSYSLASHELATILSKSDFITNTEALGVFVGDAENAVSREHTLWLARRDAR